jgi:hypothetical protein
MLIQVNEQNDFIPLTHYHSMARLKVYESSKTKYDNTQKNVNFEIGSEKIVSNQK